VPDLGLLATITPSTATATAETPTPTFRITSIRRRRHLPELRTDKLRLYCWADAQGQGLFVQLTRHRIGIALLALVVDLLWSGNHVPAGRSTRWRCCYIGRFWLWASVDMSNNRGASGARAKRFARRFGVPVASQFEPRYVAIPITVGWLTFWARVALRC